MEACGGRRPLREDARSRTPASGKVAIGPGRRGGRPESARREELNTGPPGGSMWRQGRPGHGTHGLPRLHPWTPSAATSGPPSQCLVNSHQWVARGLTTRARWTTGLTRTPKPPHGLQHEGGTLDYWRRPGWTPRLGHAVGAGMRTATLERDGRAAEGRGRAGSRRRSRCPPASALGDEGPRGRVREREAMSNSRGYVR